MSDFKLYKEDCYGDWMSILQKRSGANAGMPNQWYEEIREYESDLKAVLEWHEERGKLFVKRDLRNDWDLALVLIDAIEDASYALVFKELHAYRQTHPDEFKFTYAYAHNTQTFLYWAQTRFGLCRSSVYAMIKVIQEFGALETRKILSAYEGFTFRQLVEMLPLTPDQRAQVKPNWTIKQICDLKKLVRTCGQVSEDSDEREDEPESRQAPENPKYAQFRGWKKEQLYDRILELEDERVRMLATIDELHAKLGRRQPKPQDEPDADAQPESDFADADGLHRNLFREVI